MLELTIVAVWKDQQNILWVAADTRISSPGAGGGLVVKTDSAAKMMTLTVSCLTGRGWLSKKRTYTGRFGFAFAGAALPAMMTGITASSLLADLFPFRSPAAPPSLAEVAETVREIGTRFMREHYQALPVASSVFEAVVVGHCPERKASRAMKLFPVHTPEDGVSLQVEECDLNQVTAFGTGRDEFFQRLASMEEGDPGGMLGRYPVKAVGEMAEQGSGSVGGSLSLGIVTGGQFSPYSKLYPGEDGRATLRFNGIDLFDELSPVGDRYLIGLKGMA